MSHAAPTAAPVITPEMRAQFDEQGYLVVEGLFDVDTDHEVLSGALVVVGRNVGATGHHNQADGEGDGGQAAQDGT